MEMWTRRQANADSKRQRSSWANDRLASSQNKNKVDSLPVASYPPGAPRTTQPTHTTLHPFRPSLFRVPPLHCLLAAALTLSGISPARCLLSGSALQTLIPKTPLDIGQSHHDRKFILEAIRHLPTVLLSLCLERMSLENDQLRLWVLHMIETRTPWILSLRPCHFQ